MADCGAKKHGLGKCFRNKSHQGKHLSFADKAKGFDKPIAWEVEEKPRQERGQANG